MLGRRFRWRLRESAEGMIWGGPTSQNRDVRTQIPWVVGFSGTIDALDRQDPRHIHARSSRNDRQKAKGRNLSETSPLALRVFEDLGRLPRSRVVIARLGNSFELSPSFPPFPAITSDDRASLLPFSSLVADSLEGHSLLSPSRRFLFRWTLRLGVSD